MDLKALQTTLREFAAEREWQPFHTPKNLAMALMVEAAELAEIFQWMTPEQSQAARGDLGLDVLVLVARQRDAGRAHAVGFRGVQDERAPAATDFEHAIAGANARRLA